MVNLQLNFFSSLWIFRKSYSIKLSSDFENKRLKTTERRTLNSKYSVFLVVGSLEDRVRVWLKVIREFCISSFFFFLPEQKLWPECFCKGKCKSHWFPVQICKQAVLETTVCPQAFHTGLLNKQSIIRRVVGRWIPPSSEIGTGMQFDL